MEYYRSTGTELGLSRSAGLGEGNTLSMIGGRRGAVVEEDEREVPTVGPVTFVEPRLADVGLLIYCPVCTPLWQFSISILF